MTQYLSWYRLTRIRGTWSNIVPFQRGTKRGTKRASIDPWPKFRFCSFVPLVRYLLGLPPQTRLRPAQSAGIAALPRQKISSIHLCPEIAFLQFLRVFLCPFALSPYFWPDLCFLRILKVGEDELAGQSDLKKYRRNFSKRFRILLLNLLYV